MLCYVIIVQNLASYDTRVFTLEPKLEKTCTYLELKNINIQVNIASLTTSGSQATLSTTTGVSSLFHLISSLITLAMVFHL